MDETPKPTRRAATEPPARDVKTIEAWALERRHVGFDAWQAAAAKAHRRWVEGEEVTGAEYDAAVAEASGVALGYGHEARK